VRVSLAWHNYDDLDIHCITHRGSHIYFHNKLGVLDVDMNANSRQSRSPVENLQWRQVPEDGVYRIYVDQFSKRENVDVGFEIEVEIDGILRNFSYDNALSNNEKIEVGSISVVRGVAKFIMGPRMKEGQSTQEKWGLVTGSVDVDAITFSPNHWGDNEKGALHTFFFLKGAKNPDPVRGIFNEYLRPDLHEHRKVFEQLAAKTKAPFNPKQLSGLGFTAARGDSVTVTVDGRPYNVSF